MPNTTEPHIYLDRSGDLRTGYFYTVEFDEFVSFPDKGGPGEFLVRRSPTEADLIRKRGTGYFSVMFETSFDLKTEQRKDCPVDPNHVTQAWWKNLKVLGGEEDEVATPFVRLNGFEFVLLIRDDLREALMKSGLTGWRTAEVVFAIQAGDELGRTSNPQGYPKLWDFQFRGRARLRSWSVRNAPNACPFCGHGRVVCPGCQWMVSECPKCGELPWTTPQIVRLREKEGKKIPKGTLIRENIENIKEGILQGEHWDGSDFIQIGRGSTDPDYEPYHGDKHIITKRALDWLLARHAMPLWAKPIPVDVSKMSKQQLETLEAVKDLKSLE